MNIRSRIALVNAFRAANLVFVNRKDVASDDGGCWEMQLKHNRTKVLHLSNGGFGGPDEVEMIADKDLVNAAIKALSEVPEVKAFHIASRVDFAKSLLEMAADMKGERQDLVDEGNKILERVNGIYTNEDFAADLIARGFDEFSFLCVDLHREISEIKRLTKLATKNILVINAENGEIGMYKWEPTVANIARLQTYPDHMAKIKEIINPLFTA